MSEAWKTILKQIGKNLSLKYKKGVFKMSVGGEIVKKMIAEVEGRRYEPPKPHAPKVERHRTQGSIGGEMVRKMIEAYEKSMK